MTIVKNELPKTLPLHDKPRGHVTIPPHQAHVPAPHLSVIQGMLKSFLLYTVSPTHRLSPHTNFNLSSHRSSPWHYWVLTHILALLESLLVLVWAHLCFREFQLLGELKSLADWEILIFLKLLLQCLDLWGGEGGSRSLFPLLARLQAFWGERKKSQESSKYINTRATLNSGEEQDLRAWRQI